MAQQSMLVSNQILSCMDFLAEAIQLKLFTMGVVEMIELWCCGGLNYKGSSSGILRVTIRQCASEDHFLLAQVQETGSRYKK